MKLIIILFTLSFAQHWQPFHSYDQQKYSQTIINYNQIDNLADNHINNSRSTLTHKVIGYLPYWEYESYTNIDYSLITEINYFSAELNEFGNITNDHNWDNINFINYAQDRGVKVKLCATLFNPNDLEILLSSSINRTNAIYNLVNKVLLRNADGIDIDFELVPSNQRDNLVLFMEQLSDVFHQFLDDPIITMATPAIDWSNAWDYSALAEICDGLFIMGYNYFYSGSDTTGPVSPLGGYFYDIDFTVNDYLSKTNFQTNKLILGLPYYGYDWPVSSGLIFSSTTGNGDAKTYSQCEMQSQDNTINWNSLSSAVWFSYNDTNNWRQVWYDDSLSLSIKYNYAKSKELSGVGIWALGYDNNNPKMWGSIKDQFTEFLFGDLNTDITINIQDVIILVLSITESSEYTPLNDLNNDLVINIQDIIILVNLILDS